MGILQGSSFPSLVCSLSPSPVRSKYFHSNGMPSSIPPPPPIPIHIEAKDGSFQNGSGTRRNLIANTLLALLGALPLPAQAFSLGISGPKEWLKEQKKKTSDFLLAPIIASRDRLNRAYHLLNTNQIPFNNEYEEAQRLVKVAARDCIPLETGSFVAFQANTGVEVCTFRLVLKNASSLLDDMDPTKLKANASLNDLTRSFVQLNGLLANDKLGATSNSSMQSSWPM